MADYVKSVPGGDGQSSCLVPACMIKVWKQLKDNENRWWPPQLVVKNKCELLTFFIVEAAWLVVTMEMKTVSYHAGFQAS